MNYNEPIQQVISSELFPGSLNQIVWKDIIFYKVYIAADNGVLLMDMVEYDSFQKFSIIDRSFNFPNPPYYSIISVALTNFKDLYMRVYQKIQKALAETWGLVRFIIILLHFLNTYLARFDQTAWLLGGITLNKINTNMTHKGFLINQDVPSGNLISLRSEKNAVIKLGVDSEALEKKKSITPTTDLKDEMIFFQEVGFWERIEFLFSNFKFWGEKNSHKQQYYKLVNYVRRQLDYKKIFKMSMEFDEFIEMKKEFNENKSKIIKVKRKTKTLV